MKLKNKIFEAIDAAPSDIRCWVVTRYIVEKRCAYGKTKREALENAEAPFEVRVTRETCIIDKS